jgi:hypothetical protein
LFGNFNRFQWARENASGVVPSQELGNGQGILQHRVQTVCPQVWKIARDFNNYPVWMGGAGESWIERSQTDEFHGAATLAVAIN